MIKKFKTPLLKEIAWRSEYIFSFMTGKKALITRESANSAMTKSYYSTNKIDKFTVKKTQQFYRFLR